MRFARIAWRQCNVGKRTGIKYRYIGTLALLFWILAGISGCGVWGTGPADESRMEDSVGEDVGSGKDEEAEEKESEEEENGERDAEVVLSLQEGELRSIWMEQDVLYAFVASGDKKKSYGIYEVTDSGLSEETPYKDVMEQWSGSEMGKAAVASYEYEARQGRNGVVYLLGRDEEGCVRRCYWMEKNFYTDVLFYEKYERRAISNIEISRTGKLYLESAYGGFMIPYDDFYGRIGLGVNTETKRTILGEQRMYQLSEGWIYVWDIPSGATMEMIRCDVLANGRTPVFIDKDDSIYLVGSSGLAYLPKEGSIWEILVDKDEEGFSDSGFDLKQIWVYEEDLYLSGIDMETGWWQILRRKLPGKAVKK